MPILLKIPLGLAVSEGIEIATVAEAEEAGVQATEFFTDYHAGGFAGRYGSGPIC
jgi:hypothetical protein